jgi:hypothetical protein
MLRPSGRLTAAAAFAVILAMSTPALASAQGSAASHNGGVAVGKVAAPASHASPQSIQAAHPFPSATSQVIGSIGFIDDTQCGYFWSASRGDSVAESFQGPANIKKVILKLDVIENVLSAGATVDWTVSINGHDVGSFQVVSGELGAVTEKFRFHKLTGGTYDVKMRVTNEVAAGDGSQTFRYAGEGPHSVRFRS